MLAEFAGVAIDHARRYTGASERRDELERTVAALEATTQIARAVGGETDLDVILELVAKRGRALVSARALLIELRQRNELVIAAGAGELPAGLVGQSVALEDTVASHAIRTGRAQRLEDELTRARFDEHGLGRLGVKADGGLAVPLVFRGADPRRAAGARPAGTTARRSRSRTSGCSNRLPQRRDRRGDRTVDRLRAQRQRLAAAEGERRRWARELHDDTLQSLSALRIGLSTARTLASDPTRSRRRSDRPSPSSRRRSPTCAR